MKRLTILASCLAFCLGVLRPASGQQQAIMRSGAASGNSGTVTNLTVLGQAGFAGVTVSNLPTGIAAGYQTWASDVLTPVGTGDRVEWDGSVWKTMRMRIVATTDPATYFMNCLAQSVNLTTPLSTIYYLADDLGVIGPYPRQAVTANSGTSLTFNNVNSWGAYASQSTGSSSASGSALVRGVQFMAPVSGAYYFTSANCAFSNLPDGTDNYWGFFGFDSSGSGSLVASCGGFLYDRFNALGRGSPGSETNHYVCITGRASSFTVTDSGLTPSTLPNAPDRLAVLLTTTSVVFYTNGVACMTNANASTIPNVALYGGKLEIVKTLGTTARTMYEGRPSLHIRLASAPTFP